MKEIRTKNIQFAAFLLSKVPSSGFCIERSLVDPRYVVIVSFPAAFENLVNELTDQFYRCEATIHLFNFNRKLNLIRDSLKRGCA